MYGRVEDMWGFIRRWLGESCTAQPAVLHIALIFRRKVDSGRDSCLGPEIYTRGGRKRRVICDELKRIRLFILPTRGRSGNYTRVTHNFLSRRSARKNVKRKISYAASTSLVRRGVNFSFPSLQSARHERNQSLHMCS